MFAHIVGLFDRWKSRLAPRAREIVADDHGVRAVIHGRNVSPGFRWEDVTEIRTFKRDLGIVDDIRLAFQVGGLWYEFGEDERGFSQLSAVMHKRFPSIPEGWYFEVMQPPFATNERILLRGGVSDDVDCPSSIEGPS